MSVAIVLTALILLQIYEIVLYYEPQEIVLNLTKWQVPKMERAEQPNKNVTQYGIAITQICRAMRVETLKLYYFTNTLTLNMADFEDHVSPILAPPRRATEKLQIWHALAGAEAVKEVRKVNIMLHYHYLGPQSTLRLDSKAAAILKDVFHPDAVIRLHVTVHMPIPDDMGDENGRIRGLEVVWTIGEPSGVWEEQATLAARSFYTRFMLISQTGDDSRIRAMIGAAWTFLSSGAPSIQAYTDKPVFGPPLPPAMDAEREATGRQHRQEAWNRQQDANRRAVMGDNDNVCCDGCASHAHGTSTTYS